MLGKDPVKFQKKHSGLRKGGGLMCGKKISDETGMSIRGESQII